MKHGDAWKTRTSKRYVEHAHVHLTKYIEGVVGEGLEHHIDHALTDLAIAAELIERGK